MLEPKHTAYSSLQNQVSVDEVNVGVDNTNKEIERVSK